MVESASARRVGVTVPEADRFRKLLALHGNIERLVRQAEGRSFVSGWNAANPFVNEFLKEMKTNSDLEPTSYQSYTSDRQLLGLIQRMHKRFDHKAVTEREILPGDGSTGLIATMFLWLLRQRVKLVHYIPTVHDTFYYFFDLLQLDVRRAANQHPFEADFRLNLPAEKSVLFIADPTWYVGRPLRADIIDEIAEWQRATGSLVFVDGTWQYLQWDGKRFEKSSDLDTALTVRLIGPTKFLGLNGHRFSYLLVPEALYDDLADVHENLHGSTSLPNLAFARCAMTVMTSACYNRSLTDHVSAVYMRLAESGNIQTQITPKCGLYCFAILRPGHGECVTMGEEYYELEGYPGYVRLNLLGGAELDVLSR